MFNKCVFVGRILNEPVLEETEGKLGCYITLKMDEDDKQEEYDGVIRKVSAIACQAYGYIAELIANNLNIGDPIGITGRLGWINKENEAGEKYNRMVVIIEKLTCIKKQNKDIEEPQLDKKQSGLSL